MGIRHAQLFRSLGWLKYKIRYFYFQKFFVLPIFSNFTCTGVDRDFRALSFLNQLFNFVTGLSICTAKLSFSFWLGYRFCSKKMESTDLSSRLKSARLSLFTMLIIMFKNVLLYFNIKYYNRYLMVK